VCDLACRSRAGLCLFLPLAFGDLAPAEERVFALEERTRRRSSLPVKGLVTAGGLTGGLAHGVAAALAVVLGFAPGMEQRTRDVRRPDYVAPALFPLVIGLGSHKDSQGDLYLAKQGR